MPRHDKYEGKPIYWVEEEVEVEWMKTTNRSKTEEGQFEVAGSIADAMADASETLQLEMKALPEG